VTLGSRRGTLDGPAVDLRFFRMNREQREGRFENLKGRVKQAAGSLTGDKAKEGEGAAERATGAVKKAFGDLKEKLTKRSETEPEKKPED
jgi:uncharacterized protein YjbJ (UPF0337 family)